MYPARWPARLAIAQAILHGLGFTGVHFTLIEANEASSLEAALGGLSPAAVPPAAAFDLFDDKRATLEFAIEHLARHAREKRAEITLPEGAPYGEVLVDKRRCTLCMACVGACPASALIDTPDYPRLRFIERNCVQCGLCEKTCPEDAIRLSPRLLLPPASKEARVLNEATPFHCVRCGKPFATEQMVTTMLAKLAGHSMFAGGAALNRLRMCADCPVADMMENRNEMRITDS